VGPKQTIKRLALGRGCKTPASHRRAQQEQGVSSVLQPGGEKDPVQLMQHQPTRTTSGPRDHAHHIWVQPLFFDRCQRILAGKNSQICGRVIHSVL
jgi:hypothetical protein